jgi:chromosome segregation ATPase
MIEAEKTASNRRREDRATIRDLRDQASTDHQTIDDLQKSLQNVKSTAAKYEKKMDAALEDAQARIEELEQDDGKLHRRIKKRDDTINDLMDRLKKIKEQLQNKDSEIQELHDARTRELAAFEQEKNAEIRTLPDETTLLEQAKTDAQTSSDEELRKSHVQYSNLERSHRLTPALRNSSLRPWPWPFLLSVQIIRHGMNSAIS